LILALSFKTNTQDVHRAHSTYNQLWISSWFVLVISDISQPKITRYFLTARKREDKKTLMISRNTRILSWWYYHKNIIYRIFSKVWLKWRTPLSRKNLPPIQIFHVLKIALCAEMYIVHRVYTTHCKPGQKEQRSPN
jgi:hypothetical protein